MANNPLALISWFSPAKLNLFLHVNGQRSDGYHELQTLFQFIDYGDYLTFTPRSDSVIKLSPPLPGVANDDNLVVRAARLLAQQTSCQHGVDIALDKHLPMGGGIGGGSSNAATTLLVLNELWQCHLSLDDLAQLGLSLGADVPVFIHGQAAFAQGVGEQLMPVFPDEPWYLLLKPAVVVSTAEIFSDPDLNRCTPKQSWDRLQNTKWGNDCEAIAMKRHPEVALALQWLLEYAPSRMTGTGSCIFATFETESAAEAVRNLTPAHYSAVVCRGRNRSPLHQQLAELKANVAE